MRNVPRGTQGIDRKCGRKCLMHHHAHVIGAGVSTARPTLERHGSLASLFDGSEERSYKRSGLIRSGVNPGAASAVRKTSTPLQSSSITSCRWLRVASMLMPIVSLSVSLTAMRRHEKSLSAASIVVASDAAAEALATIAGHDRGHQNRWKSNASETALEATAHEVVFKKSLMRKFDGRLEKLIASTS